MAYGSLRLRAGFRALARDWAAGELRLLVLALIVAVAAVTSVSSLADRVTRTLHADSAQMLGGDLVIRSGQSIPDSFVQRARSLELDSAITVEFPSMVAHGGSSQLASIKAVSADYPLRGHVRLRHEAGSAKYRDATSDVGTVPGNASSGGDTALGNASPSISSVRGNARKGPENGSVWLDPQLMGLLDLALSDRLEVGDSEFEIAAVIGYEPDRSMRFVNIAPRVLMTMGDLERTGLLGPGSRVSWRLLVAGEPQAVERYRAWLEPRLEAGQQLSTLESGRPELQRSLDRAHQFLTLVTLLTIMLAAIAVALAARRFSDRHQDGVAVMRCLGLSKSALAWTLWVEFLSLALAASLVGIIVGSLVQSGLIALLASWLDMGIATGTWRPYAKGLATGVLLLLGFALPSLLALRGVAPIRVLRANVADVTVRRSIALACGLASVGILVLVLSGDVVLGTLLAGGFTLALGTFALAAFALIRAVGYLRNYSGRWPFLRFALTGMVRRRGSAVVQLCAVSVGLAILLLLTITRTDLLQGWQNTIPPDAPNTFLINIQPDQREALQAMLLQTDVGTVQMAPLVRARLTAVNGTRVSAGMYQSERAQSMVTREFNLSHRPELPPSNVLTRGRWPDASKAEASLEEGLAKTLAVTVGDTLTFEFAGLSREVTIVGLRKVKWDSFDVNFFALLSQSVLQNVPTTYIASLRLPQDSSVVQRRLSGEFANVTVFDIGAILGQVQRVLDQVVVAMQVLFLFAVAAGLAVLAAVLVATRDERMYEIAILRTLGASRAQMASALRIELTVVGGLAGLLAAGAAQLISFVLADLVFGFSLSLSWWPWLLGTVAGIVLCLSGGSLALRGVVSQSPLVSLRATS